MPILTICPHCRRKARIRHDAGGKMVRCTGCEQSFIVPQGAGELLVEWGPVGSGRRVPIVPGEVIVIGRSRGCTLCLPGPLVSRRHASLEWRDEEWQLRDEKSANGTYVNGARVRSLGLTDGSRVVVGDFALRLAVVSSGRTDMDTALDAMALDETRSGAMAIVSPGDTALAADHRADTLEGAAALAPPAPGDRPAGRLPRRSWHEHWAVLAVVVAAVAGLVALLLRLFT